MPFNLDFEESVRAIAKKLGTVATRSDEALRDFARTAIELTLIHGTHSTSMTANSDDEDAAFSHLNRTQKDPRLAWLAEDFRSLGGIWTTRIHRLGLKHT